MSQEEYLHGADVVIVGGGGALGRELHSWLGSGIVAKDVDDNTSQIMLHEFATRPQLAWARENLKGVLIAVADPECRRRMRELLNQAVRADQWVSSLDPSAITHSRLTEGAIVAPYALVSINVSMGKHLIVNTHSAIGHDVTIGDYVTIAGHVTICGRAKLGSFVSVGAGAVILPSVKVGDHATVGAGAVVTAHVPAGATVFGNPAVKVGSRRV